MIWFEHLKQDCDGAEPEYEYYDLDVGLGIHGDDVEDEIESSGDEIFDMPSFEALIGDKPNQGKETGKEYDPYNGNESGPLVAATLYRKYEYAEGIKTDREVIVEKTENVVDNIMGTPPIQITWFLINLTSNRQSKSHASSLTGPARRRMLYTCYAEYFRY